MITRTFTTLHELRTMIKGYAMLFGAPPAEVKIVAIGRHGTATSLVDTEGLECYTYINGSGILQSIGTRLVTLSLSDSTPIKVNLAEQHAQHFTATFS